MSKKTEKLICNLIGATEILEAAYLKNDQKSFYRALAKMAEIREELKKHEHYSRENGVYYD